MSSPDAYGRLATVMVRHRRAVLAGWLVAVVVGLLGLPHLLGSLASPPIRVNGSESDLAAQVQGTSMPALGNERILVVLHSRNLKATDQPFRSATDAVENALARQQGVSGVVPLPLAAEPSVHGGPFEPLREAYRDEHTAYLAMGVLGESRELQDRVAGQQRAADEAAMAASQGAVRAYLVGGVPYGQAAQQSQIDDLMRIELVAMPLAILVLLLGLRAPVAALLPVCVAGASVITTFGLFTLLGGVFRADGMLLIGVTSVGLGAGIDYTLFVLGRYREETARGASPQRAAGTALATSGRTVAYSALVVVLAMSCLLLVRWPVFTQAAIGLMTVVAVMLLASVTLLPVLLVSLGRRIEWRAWGAAGGATSDDGRLARRARHLMRRPWPYVVGVTVGLLLLAVPATDMKIGIDLERRVLADTAYGAGAAVVDRDSAGLASPISVLVRRPASSAEPDTGPLVAALRADPLVATTVKLDNGRDLTLVLVIPRAPMDSPEIVELVHRIRGDIAPRAAPEGTSVLVGEAGGTVADIVAEMSLMLWWVIGLVLLLTFVSLVVVLRSILLPLKAIAMNLLATGAAFGLAVLLFQRGAAEDLFDFTSNGTIWPQIPMIVFALLFALSMDYEIFLVRRIQEEYRVSGDNVASVAAGLQRTARPISLAALILAVSFGSLLVSETTGLKVFGFTIAAALIIDATVIRLLLVPALMRIMGRWNWWLPRRVAGHDSPARQNRTASHPRPRERSRSGTHGRSSRRQPGGQLIHHGRRCSIVTRCSARNR